jgi:hypothetical protein
MKSMRLGYVRTTPWLPHKKRQRLRAASWNNVHSLGGKIPFLFAV